MHWIIRYRGHKQSWILPFVSCSLIQIPFTDYFRRLEQKNILNKQLPLSNSVIVYHKMKEKSTKEDPQNMSKIIISQLKLETSCGESLLSFFFFSLIFPVIASPNNKHYFLQKQRYHSYYYVSFTSQEGDRVLATDWQTKQKSEQNSPGQQTKFYQ